MPGLLDMPGDILHHACVLMDKTDLAALSSTCSGLREIAIKVLFRELRIKHSWQNSKAVDMACVEPNVWRNVLKVTFLMAPFAHLEPDSSHNIAYQTLRNISMAWRSLFKSLVSLKRLMVRINLHGLDNMDSPDARVVWKYASAIFDRSLNSWMADASLAITFDLLCDVEHWSPNNWPDLFAPFASETALEVTVIDPEVTNVDNPTSLARLPAVALKNLSLAVHPSNVSALAVSANLTGLHLVTTPSPSTLFDILERFKLTLVDLRLQWMCQIIQHRDEWMSATPHQPCFLSSLKRLTWEAKSDLAVVAKFFERAHASQHCKLDISAFCDEHPNGNFDPSACVTEVGQLAKALEALGAHAIVHAVYYPFSCHSTRIRHLAQLHQVLLGSGGELCLIMHDYLVHRNGDQSAIGLLDAVAKQGLSDPVHELSVRVSACLSPGTYKLADFPTILDFTKAQKVALIILDMDDVENNPKRTAVFHLHFLLSRLNLPAMEELRLVVGPTSLLGAPCSRIFHAIEANLPHWPALKTLKITHEHRRVQTLPACAEASHEL